MTRTALVTGGSSGLGAAFVAGLLARGYRVTCLDRNLPSIEAERLTFVRTEFDDITNLPVTVAALDDVVFDLVIVNAGISAVGAFEAIELVDLERVIAINLLAPAELTRLLLVNGRVAGGGTLVFIASLSNRLGYPGASVYSATKQGLEAFANSLRRARRQKVICVLPGPLDTEHARRYAPAGGKSRPRMAPRRLAERVLKRVKRSGTVCRNIWLPWPAGSCRAR